VAAEAVAGQRAPPERRVAAARRVVEARRAAEARRVAAAGPAAAQGAHDGLTQLGAALAGWRRAGKGATMGWTPRLSFRAANP